MATDKFTIAESLEQIRGALSAISEAQLAAHLGPLTAAQEKLIRDFIDSSELLKVASALKHPPAQALKHDPARKKAKPGAAAKAIKNNPPAKKKAPAKGIKHGPPAKEAPSKKTPAKKAPAKAIKHGPPATSPPAKTSTRPGK